MASAVPQLQVPTPKRAHEREANASHLSRMKRKSKSMLRSVTHVPRISLLDRTNETTAQDPFRGFYTLFWIFTGLLVLNSFITSFQKTGEVLSMTFASLMSRDAGILALSDAVLVLSTFLCVPLVRAMHRYHWRYGHRVVYVQYVWHVVLLAAVIRWMRVRDWPWVQSGFFVLHAMVMIMKVHSYLCINGTMSDAFEELRMLESKLVERLLDVYHTDLDTAWTCAVQDTRNSPSFSPLAVLDGSKEETPFDKWASRAVQTGSSVQRAHVLLPRLYTELPRARSPIPEHRRLVEALDSDTVSAYPTRAEVAQGHCNMRDPHPLGWHTDSVVQELATRIGQQRENLYADWDESLGLSPMWPHNVTVANFFDYQLVPALVYQLQYPRTERVRPLYVLERILATFGTFLVIYVITVNWIMPVTVTEERDLLTAFVRLAAPMMLCYLLIFYLMFECVCNGFAELTRFADREFYQDWWNSASMDEFARKWNKHVYVSIIFNWGLSKTSAALFTFFLSSMLHELVMIIASGKLRGYLFFMQMSQYPLILLAQTPLIKNNRSLGNLLFWVGLMIGFPMLNIAYLVY